MSLQAKIFRSFYQRRSNTSSSLSADGFHLFHPHDSKPILSSKAVELPVVDVAAPLGDESPRLSPGGTETRSRETAQRPGFPASSSSAASWCSDGMADTFLQRTTTSRNRAGREQSRINRLDAKSLTAAFQAPTAGLFTMGDLRRLKGQNRLGHVETGIGQRPDV